MSLINTITLSRLILGPLFLFIYSGYEILHLEYINVPFALLILLVISEFTDLIDGFLARRYQQVSDLGKILDPMADSIFRISVFLTFTLAPINLPVWIIFLMLYRESIISALRTLCALKGFALAARSSGKIKAVLQASASFFILFLFACYTSGAITLATLQTYSFYAALIAAVYTVLSGLEYLYVNRGYVARLFSAN